MVSDQREGPGHPLKQLTAEKRLLLGDHRNIKIYAKLLG
jgi:hypothetical protein